MYNLIRSAYQGICNRSVLPINLKVYWYLCDTYMCTPLESWKTMQDELVNSSYSCIFSYFKVHINKNIDAFVPFQITCFLYLLKSNKVDVKWNCKFSTPSNVSFVMLCNLFVLFVLQYWTTDFTRTTATCILIQIIIVMILIWFWVCFFFTSWLRFRNFKYEVYNACDCSL